jgi:opacity protein-like surface antigen
MKLAAALACLASAVAFVPVAAQEPAPAAPPAAAPAPAEPAVPVAPPAVTPPAPPASAPATAASPARNRRGIFVGARLGLYRPGGDAKVLDDTFDFGNGLDLEGFVGVPLNRYLTVVGGVGYYRTGTDTFTGYDPTYGTVSLGFDVSVIPITASLRAGGTFDGVALYALAGVGYHMTSLEATVGGGMGGGAVSEDDDVFGWHFGVGVAFAVTPRLMLGAELRQTFVEGSYPNLLGGITGVSDTVTLDGLRFGATIAFTP